MAFRVYFCYDGRIPDIEVPEIPLCEYFTKNNKIMTE